MQTIDTLFAALFFAITMIMALYLYNLFSNAFRRHGPREIREAARDTICQSLISGRALLIFIAVAAVCIYSIAAMDLVRFATVTAVNVSIVAIAQIGFYVARTRF